MTSRTMQPIAFGRCRDTALRPRTGLYLAITLSMVASAWNYAEPPLFWIASASWSLYPALA